LTTPKNRLRFPIYKSCLKSLAVRLLIFQDFFQKKCAHFLALLPFPWNLIAHWSLDQNSNSIILTIHSWHLKFLNYLSAFSAKTMWKTYTFFKRMRCEYLVYNLERFGQSKKNKRRRTIMIANSTIIIIPNDNWVFWWPPHHIEIMHILNSWSS